MIVTSWLITYLFHSTIAYALVYLVRGRVRSLSMAELLWKSAAFLPVVTATAARMLDLGWWTLDLRPAEPLGRSLALARWSASRFTGPNWVELSARLLIVAGALWFCRELTRRAIFIRQLGLRRAADGRPAAIFAAARERAGMHREVRLTVSDALTSPIALGRREICVPPRSARSLDDRELAALFAHEFAHLRRGDEWQAWCAVILERVLFVQPMNRIARKALQRLAEAGCDAWAATHLADADAMASCLLEVASWGRGGDGLSDRIARLLAPASDPLVPTRMRLACPLVMCSVIVASPAFRLPVSWTPDFLAGYAAGLSAPVDPLQDNFAVGRELARAFRATHPTQPSR